MSEQEKERKRTEDRIQQEYVMDFRNRYCLKHHFPRFVIFSVPNEGKDGKEQQRKVGTGLLKGVSDTIINLPGIMVYCETKTPEGVQSNDQKEFQQTVEALGFIYIIVRSKSDFYEKISKIYGKKLGS